MDTTGDGALQYEEFKEGYLKIFGVTELEEDKVELLRKGVEDIDKGGQGYITYEEFLVGTIDLSPARFQTYIERAYEKYFNDPDKYFNLDKMEFMNEICFKQVMKRKMAESFFSHID
jgi:Ca2+-binding EF-hand superfamily protein